MELGVFSLQDLFMYFKKDAQDGLFVQQVKPGLSRSFLYSRLLHTMYGMYYSDACNIKVCQVHKLRYHLQRVGFPKQVTNVT